MYISLHVHAHRLPSTIPYLHTLYFYTLTDIIEARNVTVFFFPFCSSYSPPFLLN